MDPNQYLYYDENGTCIGDAGDQADLRDPYDVAFENRYIGQDDEETDLYEEPGRIVRFHCCGAYGLENPSHVCDPPRLGNDGS